MKVLEIKNNLVKIAYDVKDNLALSGFVVIEDENTPYVAQIVNMKADVNANYAIVKLLFTFNEEGILKNYNGTIPSLKATITPLPSNELLDIIPVENPVILGELAQQNIQVKVDKTILDNNLLICSNNLENTIILLDNITKQIHDKIIIFDTEGQLDFGTKITFGQDFKLPLEYDTINFIYDNELDDVDPTDKAIIQDIFIEVQEYTKTLPEGYLPFETFLDVVDQQYRETKITQLILLKNKLLKYKDLNVFAETLKDVLNLSIAIEKTNLTVIDISNMPSALQKEIISYTYSAMNNLHTNIYSFTKINNSNADKRLLKKLLERTNVFTTIICPHEFKYISEIKEVAQNLILFSPLTLQHDFANYNTFLNKLNTDEFIIYGAHTQNIPLIVELDELEFEQEKTESEKTIPMPESVNQQNEEHTNDNVSNENTEQQTLNMETEISETEKINEEIIVEERAQPKEMPKVEYPDVTIEETPVVEQKVDEREIIQVDNNIEIIENQEDVIPNILENIDDEENDDEDEILNNKLAEGPQITLEEPSIDYSVDDIDIQNDFQEPQIVENNDELVEQVAKDVDKALYEKLPSDDEITLEEFTANMESDELTEDDLNLIDDLTLTSQNGNFEFDDSENVNSVPVVPIYEADDIEDKENQNFEPGDRVSTPKYGEGIVEKMIKYGNKMLCSIEFPNIGRRLLDPSMTEITKLGA